VVYYRAAIVVDTNIAHGAGNRRSPASDEALSSAACLDAIYEAGHYFVETPDVLREWVGEGQALNYALQWRRQILAADRILVPKPPANLHNKIMAYAQRYVQRKRKEVRLVDRPALLQEFADDIFLLEAASATRDRIVISRERKIREFFACSSAEVMELRQIVWLQLCEPEQKDPDKPWMLTGDELTAWLHRLAEGVQPAGDLLLTYDQQLCP